MFFRAYSGTWSVYVLFPILYYNVVATVHRVDNFIIWCKPIAQVHLPMALMWPPFCGCQYMSCHARPSNPIIGPLVHPFLRSNFFFFFNLLLFPFYIMVFKYKDGAMGLLNKEWGPINNYCYRAQEKGSAYTSLVQCMLLKQRWWLFPLWSVNLRSTSYNLINYI
jgi:hypothetical protein